MASVELGAAWNNLGRNVVFADARCRPIAVFDESVFDDDEPSQYDLDVHAVLDLPGTGTVLTLNHYGMLRGFDITGTPPGRDGVRKAQPAWTLTFVAEFERAVGRLGINDILARICTDFGLDANFTRPRPLRARPRPGLEESVVLVTDSDGAFKHWSAEHWSSLASEVRAWGLDARVVTRSRPAVALGGDGIAAVCAPTPGDAVDVLTACRAVVGLDTGLTHIAAQQGTPTVTISRASSVYFRPWPHTRVVTGTACDDACVAAEAAYAYNDHVSLRGFTPRPRACPADGVCLAGIEPATVAAALQDLV
ncbi:MAG: glycosyltransferase family 9 protein [Actinobacteria bacterium]|nr:MAG: glycosyltransferase family 9 protein [Actinomycetota bacterium]